MNSNKKLRFGVIGCSRVAQKGMLPALMDSENAELIMVGSRTPEKAKEIAARFHAKKWGTYEEILKDGEIDAVYISLPHSMHEEWAIKAAEAGKHVLCEKPAAISYDAALRMVTAARRNKVRLLEGLMFRYHPQHAKVRDLIKRGALGDLIRFEGCFGYPLPERSSTVMQKNLGGGSLFASAPYPVYASRMMFGEEPESVLCHMEIDEESGVDVKVDMVLSYKNAKTAFASSIFGSYFQSTYSVLGTKAHIKVVRAYAIPRDMQTKVLLDSNDKVEEIVIEPADHFRLMIDDFALEVQRGENSSAVYEDDLISQAEVLEAARRSHSEKRAVRLDEVKTEKENQSVRVRVSVSADYAPVLLTGGTGKLGSTILASGFFKNILSPSHSEFDVTKPDEIRSYLEKHQPKAIIHCAAFVRMVEWAKESTKEKGIDVNIIGTCNLVKEVIRLKERQGCDIRFVYISTDGVYAGTKGDYRETDATIPYHPYGWTKLAGECAVNVLSNYCVVRTSFFDPQNIPFNTSAIDMYASKMPIDELPKAVSMILNSDFIGTINIGDERESYYARYKKYKPSIESCTFLDVTKDMHFRMAKDASLDISTWKEISNELEKSHVK